MSEGDLPSCRLDGVNQGVSVETYQPSAVWSAVRNAVTDSASERQGSSEIFPFEQGSYPAHVKPVSARNPSQAPKSCATEFIGLFI